MPPEQDALTPAEPRTPPRPAEPTSASAVRWLANVLFESAKGRAGKLLFALGFIIVAAFVFKDQRLAEEAKKAEKAEPAPAPTRPAAQDDPLGSPVRPGARRLTPEEAETLILPDTVVVLKGRQDQKGFRVAYVENDFAFAQSLLTGQYAAFHVAGLERKRVPDRMPPPAELPARPRPKTD